MMKHPRDDEPGSYFLFDAFVTIWVCLLALYWVYVLFENACLKAN